MTLSEAEPTIEDMWLSGYYPSPELCIEPELVVTDEGMFFSSAEALVKWMDSQET